jgi:hypothetical protein
MGPYIWRRNMEKEGRKEGKGYFEEHNTTYVNINFF